MYEFIEYETSAGIAELRLDRPSVRNALSVPLLSEFEDALQEAEADDVYAVIITGNGPTFSAGGDIPTVQEWRTADRESFEAELGSYQAVVEQLRSMGTPSVAAVNGPAVGAGCDVALACDLRVVSPDAELTEGFVTIGLISGDGGAWLLPRLIGEARAKEYLLTGRSIGAGEAVDIGLATARDGNPVERARELAGELRDLPAMAVQRTNQLATTTPETLGEHLERALVAQWECAQDDEHAETLSARLDGRAPELDRPDQA